MKWVQGDIAKVQCGDTTVDAEVVLVSPNGRSLMLAFEGFLGRHHGAMPVLADADGHYHSIITGEPVTLSPVLRS